jgi:Ca2+-binding RTX toxin-like protein
MGLEDIVAPLAVIEPIAEIEGGDAIAPLVSAVPIDHGGTEATTVETQIVEEMSASGPPPLTLLAIIDGTDGPDVLTGTTGDDTIRGRRGDDTIFGAAGDDELRGNGGEDTIRGGSGADFIDGGKGADTLLGGAGDDDIADRGGGADRISGGAGNDTVFGRGGGDVIRGGAGDDTLFGGAGRDRLSGGDGSDSLIGQKGNDNLNGGAGDDALRGDAGSDVLRGGEGQDSFRYIERTGGLDEILDFDQSEGDRVFISAGVFDQTPVPADTGGFVRIEDRGDDAVLQIDPDGSRPEATFVDLAVLTGNAGIELDVSIASSGSVLIS